MILVIEIVCCSILFAILLIWRIKTKPEWKIQDSSAKKSGKKT